MSGGGGASYAYVPVREGTSIECRELVLQLDRGVCMYMAGSAAHGHVYEGKGCVCMRNAGGNWLGVIGLGHNFIQAVSARSVVRREQNGGSRWAVICVRCVVVGCACTATVARRCTVGHAGAVARDDTRGARLAGREEGGVCELGEDTKLRAPNGGGCGGFGQRELRRAAGGVVRGGGEARARGEYLIDRYKGLCCGHVPDGFPHAIFFSFGVDSGSHARPMESSFVWVCGM